MTLSQDIGLGFITRLLRLIKLRLNASIGNAPTMKGFLMRLFFLHPDQRGLFCLRG